ncbi:Ig-like domain-containing protein [Novipirellula sp. SH528]|uniref:Ig-like domain-containing protein n=1 Tax=Novipirellula sp. SH528 TaxID=3454466 RepID=UPI003F9FD126
MTPIKKRIRRQKARHDKKRRLKLECLESRQLLACTPTSANGIFTAPDPVNNTLDEHQFAITSVSPNTTVSIDSGNQTYIVEGALRNDNLTFSDASAHGLLSSIGVTASGPGIVSSSLVSNSLTLSDANRQIDFRLNVVASPGTSTATYTVRADRDNARTGVPVVNAFTRFCLNQRPNAQADSGATNEKNEVSGNVLTNDSDTSSDNSVDDNNALFVSKFNGSGANVGQLVTLPVVPESGKSPTIQINADGSYNFDPNGAYDFLTPTTSRTLTVSYEVSDGIGQSSSTLTISVTGVNDAPTATNDQYSTDENVNLIVSVANGVLANDNDVDNPRNDLSVRLGQDIPPEAGVLTLNTDGSFEFAPATGFNGQPTFEYIVTDGSAESRGTVTLVVNAIFDQTILTGIREDTGVPNDRQTNQNRLTFFGTAQPGPPAVSVEVIRIDNNNVIATATVNPDGTWQSNLSDALPDGTIQVAAIARQGTENSQSAPLNVTVDTVSPSVLIEGAPTIVNNTNPIPVVIQFGEGVRDFVLADIQIGGGTAPNFSTISASRYGINVTPDGSGPITIDVPAAVATDAAGNGNRAATRVTIQFDAVQPALNIQNAPAAVNNTNPFEVTFQFTENVFGFAAADVNVTGGSLINFVTVDDDTYTANVTPNGTADVTISVAAGAANDSAGNPNTANSTTTVFDDDAPMLVSLSPADDAVDVAVGSNLVLTFGEPIAVGSGAIEIRLSSDNSLVESIDVGGHRVTVDGSVLTANPNTALQPGIEYFILVASSAITDAAGNSFVAINDSNAWNFRTTSAATINTVARQSPAQASTNADQVTFRVTFSDAVVNVDASDFVVTPASATIDLVQAVSGAVYDVTISNIDNDNGVLQLTVSPGNDIQDTNGIGLGNATAASSESFEIDNRRPSLQITAPQQVSSVAPIAVTFEFDEDVTGFNANDIQLTNATAGVFTVNSAASYTLSIVPTGGDISIEVVDNVATDPAGNAIVGNQANVATQPRVVDVIDVAPDPRRDGVASIDVVVSERLNVNEFTFADVSLSHDGNPLTLDNSVTVTEVSPTRYRISGLASLTSPDGVYSLTIAGVGLQDVNGNAGVSSASDTWTVRQTPDPSGPCSIDASSAPFLPGGIHGGGELILSITTMNNAVRIGSNCVVNISSLGSSDSVVINGTLLDDEGNAPSTAPIDHQITGFLRRESTAVANTVVTNGIQTGSFSFIVPVANLIAGSNTLTVDLQRTDIPHTASDILNFTVQVDLVRPEPVSFTRRIPTTTRTNANSVTFRTTFSEPVKEVDGNDFVLIGSGAVGASIASVTPISQTVFDVRVDGIANDGKLDLDFAPNQNISDLFDNALRDLSPDTEETYDIDRSAPTFDDPPQLISDDDTPQTRNTDGITAKNDNLTFVGSAGAADSVQVTISNGNLTIVSMATLVASGNYSAKFEFTNQPGGVLADGSYDITATARDNANNEATSKVGKLVIDTVAPEAPNLSMTQAVLQTTPIELSVAADPDAIVTLRRNGADVTTESPASGQRVASISDSPSVDANGETFQYTAVQTDVAGNTSVNSAPYVAVVDPIQPTLSKFALATADNVLPNSALPVPITRSTRPVFEIQLGDQQYAQLENKVTVSLFANDDLVNPIGSGVATFAPQVSTIAGANTNATTKVQVTLLPGVELDPGVQYNLTFIATDSAGKTTQLVKQVFVLAESNTTQNAPSTPVYTESFFIGANVLEVRPSQKQIVVDQKIPAGYAINIAASNSPIRVANSVTDEATGRSTLTLKLDTTETLDKVKINDKVAWLRPWQMSFDKTTQTVWFTMEDGHHLGQFDPATGSVEIHDISIPSKVVRNSDGVLVPAADAKPTAFDPHGTFFDFNTHLTPRVWFVYRNQVEGGVAIDDAPEDSVNNEILRVSYYDVAQKKLFTFDFNEIAGQFEIEEHNDDISTATTSTGSGGGGGTGTGGGGGTTQAEPESSSEAVPLKVGHAVFVDTKGSVWISAEDSGTIVELNFDNPTSGKRPATLNTMSAKTTAHVIPKSFGADTSTSTDFHVHGVQAIVDDRDGATYVWMLNGNTKGGETTQRLALLVPGETTDQWFEFAIPRRTTGGSHLLFTAFDDNETPGIPEDDRLVFTDSGFSFTSSGDGILATMDVGEIIRAIQEGRDVSALTPEVRSIQIPKIPGAASGSTFSAPNQVFVDRGGTTFVIDPQGGVARLNLDDFNGTEVFTTKATASAKTITPQQKRITLQEAATSTTIVNSKLDLISGTDPARSQDRSQMDGVDQYEVAAEALRRGNGEGPFRGALNAANTLYGSLSQSDSLSTTIFAESTRRQTAAVPSPLPSPAGAITQARMAFQVLRNGSLVLTARGDATIADSQINLLAKFVNDKQIPASEAAKFLITGESSAVTMPDGSVHVMGRSTQGGVVQYSFTPDGNDWAHDDLFNTANWTVAHREIPGVILAEDTVPAGPLGFSATTTDGHWIAIPINPSAATTDLTLASGSVDASRVYSTVSVTLGDNGVLYGYGTNQTGNLIEYRIDGSAVSTRQIDATSRETRVMRNVRALTMPNGVRHVFATDGTSRLVHWTIDSSSVLQENISQQTADNGQNFGYFPFQQPFTGRVYTYVAPLVEDDGTIRVYGTNGGDLIEFTLPPSGQWRVANLTNDTNGTYGADGPGYRVPANAVFGGPAAYIDSNGGRHILQINGEGEVVEYFTYGDKLFPNTTDADRINSQNVNFFSGKSTTALGAELPATIVKTVAPTSVAPATTPAVSTPTPTITEVTETTPNPTSAPTPTTRIAVAEDVNEDGFVTAHDVLLIINHLPRTVGAASALGEQTANSPYNLDVNGDTQVTALDALRVINYLNKGSSQGQSESTAPNIGLDLSDENSRSWQSEVDGVMNDLEEGQLF